MEDKHKRVTQPQFDLWIENPVTKAYLQCLNWSSEQQQEIVGSGGLVDTTNNDKSMNQIQYALGTSNGLQSAVNPLDHLHTHQMIELEEEEAA